MKARTWSSLFALALLVSFPLAAGEEPATPQVKIPEPGVPEIMNLEGRFVRAAYNNEGYAILGYRVANLSVGEKWMLLDIGLTLRDKVKDQIMTRDALTLETPDGQTIPMATIEEYRKAPLGALQKRAQVQSDAIDYFPPQATWACRIGFFSDVEDRARAWSQVGLASQSACMGRIFFNVPAGIARGQHWLNVKFENSVVRVPFRILTDEEYKYLDKNYKSIEKQVKQAFSPKKD